jgi:hypothetical protein
MANTLIALKKSATPTSTPSSLANGELAINYADGKIFYKAANGAILSISGSSANSFSTVNANGTLVVADSPTTILTVEPGNDIAIVGDAVNDKITISVASTLSTNIGTGANSYAAAIGTSGNTYLLATIAGANTAVGTGANNYLLATLAGANSAVGTGANSYANTIGTSGNTYLLATLSGANTAVGGGANAYSQTLATAGNNYATSIGTAANSYMISVQDGANTAVGTGANTISIAAFDKANTANLYAFFVDSNTIAAFTQANNVAGAVTTANTIAIAAFAKANAANLAAGAAFDGDNVTRIIANAAFAKANTGGGASGGYYKGNSGDVNPGGVGDIFRVHSQNLSANVYISSGNNSLAAGPITISTGYILQINTGARVAIV